MRPERFCSIPSGGGTAKFVYFYKMFTVQDAVSRISASMSAEDSQLLQNNFGCLNGDPLVVAAVVALVHLRDQITWGTIPQSCLPELLYTMTAQIAASVSGRYDQFDRYRRQLSEKELHLNGNNLTEIVYVALASGFTDKWRLVSNRSS